MRRHTADCSRILDSTAYADDELAQVEAFIRFDRASYLAENPDVAAAGIDPLRHYLGEGISEGRLPSAIHAANGEPGLDETLGFDQPFYRARYPDVTSEPFLHFLSHGARERRFPFDVGENLASEQLAAKVLKRAGITHDEALEAQTQFEPAPWSAVPAVLEAAAAQGGLAPKPYRNNYWLAMAIGLLAQGRLGAAACCYNFFFNYYVPMARIGNDRLELFGTARIVKTAGALAGGGGPTRVTGVATHVAQPEPVFLNRPVSATPSTRHALPAPTAGVLTDVEAVSGSSLVLRRGHVALYDYAETGPRARELQCPNLLHVAGDHCSFRLPARIVQIDEAFSLLHDHGHNYHHWLLEVLPRYLLARKQGLPATVPLLIEGPVGRQLREILQQDALGDPPLAEIPRGASAQVKRLHWMSDLCVNKVHTDRAPARDDILFSPTAVQLLRELAAPHFASPHVATMPRRYDRVLITRANVQFRRLVNRGVLQTAMETQGCWSFDPGQASWVEQVRVFSNARLIVAEAGAALANLVFCQQGATVIVLVNGHANSNYFYLAQLAALVGCRLVLFECLRLAGSHALGVQDDMIVPLEDLSRAVRRLLADDAALPQGAAPDAVTVLNPRRKPRPDAPARPARDEPASPHPAPTPPP